MSLIQIPLVLPGVHGPYPGIHDFQWKLNRRCPRATIEQITINTDLGFSAQFTQVGVVVRWGLRAQRWTCCVINEAIYNFSHAFDELLNTIEQTIEDDPVRIQSSASPDEQSFAVNVTDRYSRPVSNWNMPPFENWTVTQPPPHIINDEDLEAAKIQPLLIRDEATSVAGIHPTQSEQFDTEDIPIKLYDPQKAAIKRLMFLLDTVGLPENVKVQLRTFLANLNNPPSDSVPSSKRRKIDRSILEEERESPSV